MNTKTEKPQKKPQKKNQKQPNLDKCSLAHEKIVNIKCVVLYWLRKGPRTSQLRQKLFSAFLFSKILAFSYFYMRADTHGAIADCEIDLVSCTTGLYFPHSSTFLIRSHMPWGARETLWLDLSVLHCPFVSKGLEF